MILDNVTLLWKLRANKPFLYKCFLFISYGIWLILLIKTKFSSWKRNIAKRSFNDILLYDQCFFVSVTTTLANGTGDLGNSGNERLPLQKGIIIGTQ